MRLPSVLGWVAAAAFGLASLASPPAAADLEPLEALATGFQRTHSDQEIA